ncbi:Chromate transporter [Paenibacillus algicola]|uniref:Chromate transporter n=2 Tax=Paenibacillus algicola TaxID=2565926 RepID=A0A4V1G3N2_9BACL|nr:Chromate transporter [Paenibacillus algicola]
MKSNSNVYMQLSLAMLRTGILGYGGGPSVIPLIRHEAVIRYGWLTLDEFGETLALANALPGPIATKMAAYLGYQQKKTPGAIIAVLSHILPTCFAMIALFSAVQVLSSSSIIAGMIAGVTPVIAVMLGTMAYEFGEKAVKGLGLAAGSLSFIIAFLLLQQIQLHPAVVIMLFLAYGAMHYKLLARWKRQRAARKEE